MNFEIFGIKSLFWQSNYVKLRSVPEWEVYASWITDFLVFSTHSTISVNFKAKRKDATLTKAWTKAIDRKNKDGSNWMPSKNHFICGKHFFSGRPSTNSRQGVIEAWKTSLFDIMTFCFFDHFFTNSWHSFTNLRIRENNWWIRHFNANEQFDLLTNLTMFSERLSPKWIILAISEMIWVFKKMISHLFCNAYYTYLVSKLISGTKIKSKYIFRYR